MAGSLVGCGVYVGGIGVMVGEEVAVGEFVAVEGGAIVTVTVEE
jgi:hypothetical protein